MAPSKKKTTMTANAVPKKRKTAVRPHPPGSEMFIILLGPRWSEWYGNSDTSFENRFFGVSKYVAAFSGRVPV